MKKPTKNLRNRTHRKDGENAVRTPKYPRKPDVHNNVGFLPNLSAKVPQNPEDNVIPERKKMK